MIYSSQEPLRVIKDLEENTILLTLKVPDTRSKQFKDKFRELPRLEEPMKSGDSCYLYIQTGCYLIQCING